jgi:hypothetical protein
MNTKDTAKILVGILDDLTKIHTGEKTPRQVGIERDAIQVINTIKNLQDKGNHVDPYQLAQTLTNIIEQHIQDPLLREAYKKTIQHYLQTHTQIPRNTTYLEKIIEKERELEQKLEQLTHENRKLTKLETMRIANLYRMLMLLTPYPTLKETKRFYSQLAEKLKIKVENEAFLPVHGPVAEDVASSFAIIRKAKPEEKDEVVRREIASFEPLFQATPHIKEGILTVLATAHELIVPREKHERFIRHIERMQIRGVID